MGVVGVGGSAGGRGGCLRHESFGKRFVFDFETSVRCCSTVLVFVFLLLVSVLH